VTPAAITHRSAPHLTCGNVSLRRSAIPPIKTREGGLEGGLWWSPNRHGHFMCFRTVRWGVRGVIGVGAGRCHAL
jgi:hypothetical protein